MSRITLRHNSIMAIAPWELVFVISAGSCTLNISKKKDIFKESRVKFAILVHNYSWIFLLAIMFCQRVRSGKTQPLDFAIEATLVLPAHFVSLLVNDKISATRSDGHSCVRLLLSSKTNYFSWFLTPQSELQKMVYPRELKNIYHHHPERKKRKSSEGTLGSVHPYGRYGNAGKTSKTISTIAILWPVKAIFEKRAAMVQVDTRIADR